MPIYVANLQHRSRDDHEMLRRSKNHLHAPAANTILRPADALRRTAFLDVSSLNFGGAKSTAVFLPTAVVDLRASQQRGHERHGSDDG
jgi:hypothetical protein